MNATPSGRVVGRVVDASACGYWWLLEAFATPLTDGDTVIGYGEGGVYADEDVKGTTTDAWHARWFATKEEAEAALALAPSVEGRLWRATEHGFYGG